MSAPVRVEADESAGLPDCPIAECDFQTYNPHRMHDHLGPDGHDLWAKVIERGVITDV